MRSSFPAFLSFPLLFALPLAAQGMPSPAAEHQALAKLAGTWDATIESMGMDGKPTASKGVSQLRSSLGGFWLIDDFDGEFSGMPFQGHGVLGFDPKKGKYVQSWTDSMSPVLMMFEGTFDKPGKVLTLTGTGPGMDGELVPMRNVTTLVDANTYTFEMFMPGQDGKETRMLKITYLRRAVSKTAEPARGTKK